jgi:pyrroline-5-carboxylate reductase
MATALISGLVNPPRAHIRIRVSDPSERARKHLGDTFEIPTYTDSIEAIDGADVIVLAVKPQTMPEVLEKVGSRITSAQLILSIAAGITIASIEEHLGDESSVIRSMPNTPALIGHGITGVTAGEHCSRQQCDQAEEILAAAGEVVWLEDESLMDAITAVSGTGPAYYFLMTEALAHAARELGLPGETADRLAAITCFGAGAMMATSPDEAVELRRRVTSPGGTTEAAMAILEGDGFHQLMLRAVEAARDRSRDLALK